MIYKIQRHLLTTFCLIIVLIASIGIIFNDDKIDRVENRTLAAFPTLKDTTAKEYFDEISLYVNDHFGGRKFYLKQDKKISKFFKNSTAEGKASFGKNGYLFYNDCLNLFFSKTEKIKGFKEGVKDLSQRYKDTPIYIVIVPNKTEIYPEFVFDNEKRTNTRDNIIIEISDMAKDLSNVYVLDLKTALLEAKNIKEKPDDLYPTNNTHWTGYGAYFAYKNIISFINKNSNLNLYIKDDIKEVKVTEKRDSDLIPMLNLGKEFFDNNSEVIFNEYNAEILEKRFTIEENPIVTDFKNNHGKQKVFIMHDSFLNASLGKYLAESFASMVNIWTWKFELVKEQVDEVKPDIIIIETVDRHLMKF